MTDTERTQAPLYRRLPYSPVKCPACLREKRRGSTPLDPDHTRVPGECRYPKCLGCRHKRHMDHHLHTRKAGECRVYGIERIIWRCPSCRTGKHSVPHVDPKVDLGACRFHGIDPRRRGAPRAGHHPRDPARHPTEDVTQSRRMDPTPTRDDEEIISMMKTEKEHRRHVRDQASTADAETQAGGSLDWSRYKI